MTKGGLTVRCFLVLLQLIVGNKEDCMPRNGRWNFNNKVRNLISLSHNFFFENGPYPSTYLLQRLWAPTKIERWAIVNFSARCDMSHLSRELINCGRNKGIVCSYIGLICLQAFQGSNF